MTKHEFLIEFEKMTISDPGSLSFESNLNDLPGWDSMAVLSFISLVDEKMNKRIPIEKIKQCKIVEDLYNLINE